VKDYSELFVGMDVSKLKVSVAVVEGVRNGEVRLYGDIPCSPAAVAAMIKKLAKLWRCTSVTRLDRRATSFIAKSSLAMGAWWRLPRSFPNGQEIG
jgi:hypothetical protein